MVLECLLNPAAQTTQQQTHIPPTVLCVCLAADVQISPEHGNVEQQEGGKNQDLGSAAKHIGKPDLSNNITIISLSILVCFITKTAGKRVKMC